MPLASQLNTSHTVMRNPRTHGWPERLPGSMVMREAMPRAYHWPCNEVLLRSPTAEIKRVPRPMEYCSPQAGLRSAVMTLHWLGLPISMMPAGDLGVHCIRRQIDLTGPRNRATINEDLFEKLHIRQRRQRTGQLFRPQPHTSRQSVFESDKEAVARLRLYLNYVPVHSTPFRSRQRLNLRWGRVSAAEPPVFKQFLSMYHAHS